MKIFNQPASYVLLTLVALILFAHRFDVVPKVVLQVAFAVAFLIFLYFILLAGYNWVTQDLLPAWRKAQEARKARKGGQDNA